MALRWTADALKSADTALEELLESRVSFYRSPFGDRASRANTHSVLKIEAWRQGGNQLSALKRGSF